MGDVLIFPTIEDEWEKRGKKWAEARAASEEDFFAQLHQRVIRYCAKNGLPFPKVGSSEWDEVIDGILSDYHI